MSSLGNLAATQKVEKRAEPLDQTAAPLLRPHQVRTRETKVASFQHQLESARKGLKFGAPASTADTRRAMQRVQRDIEEQSPRPYEPAERDAAIAAEAELAEQIKTGMPTGEEMRKNPPGAVSKHRIWDKRTKPLQMAWKNIRLRLHASGMLPESGDTHTSDVASIERLRKHHDSGQLAMDNAQIPGKQFLIPATIDPKNVMSEAEREAARAETVLIVQRLNEMKSDKRRQVLNELMGG